MFPNSYFARSYFPDSYYPPLIVEIEIIDVRRTGGDEFVFEPRSGEWKHDRDFIEVVKVLLSAGILDD